jgi:hypothetical protein
MKLRLTISAFGEPGSGKSTALRLIKNALKDAWPDKNIQVIRETVRMAGHEMISIIITPKVSS